MGYAYEIIGIWNGRPAGWIDTVLTKEAASKARSHVSIRVKRVTIDTAIHDAMKKGLSYRQALKREG